ncbi:hypothetical protein COO60DRAFT_307043 [Scenedesmus sp. NREL 46B-D3]|nr:hypothetical protein COO60DRAFT_307043 [Scenedesmus sp. NREL 46B-D3]
MCHPCGRAGTRSLLTALAPLSRQFRLAALCTGCCPSIDSLLRPALLLHATFGLPVAAGDSAGGNLVLTGLGLLREQNRLAALPSLPEALVLLSPAVDMGNASVFARAEPVSSHIDADKDSSAAAAVTAMVAACDGEDVLSQAVNTHKDAGKESSPAAAVASGIHTVADTVQQQQPDINNSSNSSYGSLKFSELKQQILQHQQQHQLKQQQRQHQVGGPAGPLQLLAGLAGEVGAAWAAHCSKAGTAAAAAAGWFDYLPGSSVADNIHHYLHDPALLSHPLVSPALLPDLRGLSKRGMLVVAGGAELMRPDITAFAATAATAGVAVHYHEEAGECHCYAVLALPHMLQKSHVVLQYVEKVALASCDSTSTSDTGRSHAVSTRGED